MVKRNAIATKLTKRCTQTQKRAFDVAVDDKDAKSWSQLRVVSFKIKARTRLTCIKTTTTVKFSPTNLFVNQ